MADPRRATGGPLAQIALTCALVAAGGPACAFDIDLPSSAVLVASSTQGAGDHPLATGPFTDGTVPTARPTGVVQTFTWQIPTPQDGPDPGVLAAMLADQLQAQGYETVFTCTDRACGGFDFRHALPVGEPPEMHIDLGDFHYIAARRTDADDPAHVALMISRGGRTAYLNLALVAPEGSLPNGVTQSSRASPATTPTAAAPAATPDAPLADRLLSQGRATLDDLEFETGSSALTAAAYRSLDNLAAFLADTPDRRIVLVGHTDAEGSLDGNIALSRARARAVRTYLIEMLGANPVQIQAEGIGFLAPRASNATAEGRQANRRVEVVLATTD